MKLIVGLGNPGEKYNNTRHNVGFVFVEKFVTALAKEAQWEASDKFKALFYKSSEGDLMVVKPQTFMNDSGSCVSSLSVFYKIPPSEIYVVHDDLDLRLGEYKIQEGIGPKLHYGIASIEKSLATKDFWRVRVGVDNRDAVSRTAGQEYVLDAFSEEELKVLDGILNQIVNEIKDRLFK